MYSVIVIRRLTPQDIKVSSSKIKYSVVLIDNYSQVASVIVPGLIVKKYLKVDLNVHLAFCFVEMQTSFYYLAYPFLNQLIFEETKRRFGTLHIASDLSKILIPAVYSHCYGFDSLDLAVNRVTDYLQKTSEDVNVMQLDLFDTAPI